MPSFFFLFPAKTTDSAKFYLFWACQFSGSHALYTIYYLPVLWSSIDWANPEEA